MFFVDNFKYRYFFICFFFIWLTECFDFKIRICFTTFGKRKPKNEDQSVWNKSGLYHDNCVLLTSSLLFNILFSIQIVNASFAKLSTRNIGFMDTFTIPTVRKRNITPVIDTKGKDIIFFPIHLPGHWALWVRCFLKLFKKLVKIVTVIIIITKFVLQLT